MANLEELLSEYEYQIHETSFIGLKPGDLVMFDYINNFEVTSRFGIVVRSKRTGVQRGYFLSTRFNTLLNIFLLDSITLDSFEIMINNLYRNRIRCTYKNSPRILGSFLGQDNFRTFNVSKIRNIYSFLINK